MLESKHGIFFPQCKLNEYWPSICCHMRLTSHRDFVWRSWPFQQPSENPPIIIIECTRSTGQTNTRYNPRGLWLRDVGGTSSETVRPVSQTHNGLNWNRKIASGGTIRGEQKSNNQKKTKESRVETKENRYPRTEMIKRAAVANQHSSRPGHRWFGSRRPIRFCFLLSYAYCYGFF